MKDHSQPASKETLRRLAEHYRKDAEHYRNDAEQRPDWRVARREYIALAGVVEGVIELQRCWFNDAAEYGWSSDVALRELIARTLAVAGVVLGE